MVELRPGGLHGQDLGQLYIVFFRNLSTFAKNVFDKFVLVPNLEGSFSAVPKPRRGSYTMPILVCILVDLALKAPF